MRWRDDLCPAFEPYIVKCSCFRSNSIKHTTLVRDPLFTFLQLRVNVNKRPCRALKLKGKKGKAGMTVALSLFNRGILSLYKLLLKYFHSERKMQH